MKGVVNLSLSGLDERYYDYAYDIFTGLSLVPGAQKVIKRRRVRNRTRRAAVSLASFCVILSILSQSYLLNDRLQQVVITLAYFKLNLIRNEI